MSPSRMAKTVRKEEVGLPADHECLRRDAVTQIISGDVPALPVAGADGKLVGIFGERIETRATRDGEPVDAA